MFLGASQTPAHGALDFGTAGPGDEQVNFFVWSCSCPLMPTCPHCLPGFWLLEEGHVHTSFAHMPHSSSCTRESKWSYGAGWEPWRAPHSKPVYGVSSFSSSHLGGRHGWEGVRGLPSFLPDILLTALESLWSQWQESLSFSYHVSPQMKYVRVSPLLGKSLRSFRVVSITVV